MSDYMVRIQMIRREEVDTEDTGTLSTVVADDFYTFTPFDEASAVYNVIQAKFVSEREKYQ